MNKFILVAFTLAVLLPIIAAQFPGCFDNGHFQMYGCNCQCGGSDNGHCHCGHEIPGFRCVFGDHWICMPFENEICQWCVNVAPPSTAALLPNLPVCGSSAELEGILNKPHAHAHTH